MEFIIKILEVLQVTHDVKCFRLEKPEGFRFLPGQATDVSINKPGLEKELRPFTFTSLNQDTYLEFTIKRYTEHHGVTGHLHQLVVGDELIIREPWGAIEYKGPGYFIAGGAGITPFMAILRQLQKENSIKNNFLFYSNKTAADIIYEEELKGFLNSNADFLLTRETKSGYRNEHISKGFLEKKVTDFSKQFYICGPDKMVSDISGSLKELGVNLQSLVFEK